MRSAFVLAAGLGTRLRPLTLHVPKPLVPVGDRPVLDRIVEEVARVGNVVVNACYLADLVAARAAALGARASVEAELLGTAGGLLRAAPLLAPGPCLVWNADIVARLSSRDVMAAHDHDDAAAATLVVRPCPRGEGTVGLDASGAIVRLRGETFGTEAEGGAFLGVHVVGAELRARLPETGCLVGDVYLPALRRGERLATFRYNETFFDVGDPSSYLAANLAWLAERGADVHVAPSAIVDAGVRIARSVVGAGARVEADVSSVVVLPGAVVSTPVERAIVTPYGTIAIAPS